MSNTSMTEVSRDSEYILSSLKEYMTKIRELTERITHSCFNSASMLLETSSEFNPQLMAEMHDAMSCQNECDELILEGQRLRDEIINFLETRLLLDSDTVFRDIEENLDMLERSD